MGPDAWSHTRAAPAGARKGAKKAALESGAYFAPFLAPAGALVCATLSVAVAPTGVALEEISEALGAKPQREKQLVHLAVTALRLAYPILLLHVLFPVRLHWIRSMRTSPRVDTDTYGWIGLSTSVCSTGGVDKF